MNELELTSRLTATLDRVSALTPTESAPWQAASDVSLIARHSRVPVRAALVGLAAVSAVVLTVVLVTPSWTGTSQRPKPAAPRPSIYEPVPSVASCIADSHRDGYRFVDKANGHDVSLSPEMWCAELTPQLLVPAGVAVAAGLQPLADVFNGHVRVQWFELEHFSAPDGSDAYGVKNPIPVPDAIAQQRLAAAAKTSATATP